MAGDRSGARILACCGGMISPTGAERMTFEVLGVLREQGAEVHCILSGWGSREIEPMAERIGATWSTGGYRVKFDRHTRRPMAVLRQVRDILNTSAHLLRQAIRFRPTAIFVPDHVSVVRNYPALLCLRLAGVPCVMRLCNAPESSPFYHRLWRSGIDPLVGRYVCNSSFSLDALLAHGIAARKASIIRGVPSRRRAVRQAGPRDPGRVIFVGQVIPPKGVHVLLDAMGVLASRGLDATLDIVGRVEGWLAPEYGNYWDQVRARAMQPDLAGRIRFLGWREDVDALLRESAVHCCPSLPEQRESFAGVVLEAKAAGIPSVVCPTGGLPEGVRHRVDGWVSRDCTAEGLAEGLAYFLEEPARAAAAGAEARAANRQHDAFAREWQAVFAMDERPADQRAA